MDRHRAGTVDQPVAATEHNMYQVGMLALAMLLAALLCMRTAGAEDAAETEAIPAQVLEQAAMLRDAALAENRAFEWVRTLTSEVGPRLAGSDGDRAAVAWALTTLGELGFDTVRAEDVAVPRWERGQTRVQITSPYTMSLAAETLGGSVGTTEAGIEAPVIKVNDVAELETLAPEEVAGKIVYLGQRMRRTRDASGYDEVLRNRIDGPAVAGALGAAGLVIRSLSTANHRLAHTGAIRYRPGQRRIPAFALANPDADLLEYQFATGQPVSLRLYSSARHLGTARSANVIGEIRGRDRPEEIVLLGAHLDSWDLGTGALDDAAGVAIVIEAARLVAAAARPARTIRVVLYANEELGLSGAQDYLRRHRDTLDRHIVAIEADLGAAMVWQLASRVADSALPIVTTLHTVLAPLGVELGPNTAFGGADIQVLFEHGVPGLELVHDATHYFDYHHSASDTLDKIDAAQLTQAVAAYTALTHVLANMTADLGRLAVETEVDTLPPDQ